MKVSLNDNKLVCLGAEIKVCSSGVTGTQFLDFRDEKALVAFGKQMQLTKTKDVFKRFVYECFGANVKLAEMAQKHILNAVASSGKYDISAVKTYDALNRRGFFISEKKSTTSMVELTTTPKEFSLETLPNMYPANAVLRVSTLDNGSKIKITDGKRTRIILAKNIEVEALCAALRGNKERDVYVL